MGPTPGDYLVVKPFGLLNPVRSFWAGETIRTDRDGAETTTPPSMYIGPRRLSQEELQRCITNGLIQLQVSRT